MLDRSKYREMKYRRTRKGLLSDWYGAEDAAAEGVSLCPCAQPIGEAIAELSAKVFRRETLQRMKLDESWAEVAGAQLAALTRVGGFHDGVLTVEVRHSAFLRELAGTTDLLRDRVNAAIGGGCREIRLAPSSGFRRR